MFGAMKGALGMGGSKPSSSGGLAGAIQRARGIGPSSPPSQMNQPSQQMNQPPEQAQSIQPDQSWRAEMPQMSTPWNNNTGPRMRPPMMGGGMMGRGFGQGMNPRMGMFGRMMGNRFGQSRQGGMGQGGFMSPSLSQRMQQEPLPEGYQMPQYDPSKPIFM